MDIYERYGRKTEQLEQVIEGHFRTLGLLKALKNGELTLNDIEVTDSGWEVKNKEPVELAKRRNNEIL